LSKEDTDDDDLESGAVAIDATCGAVGLSVVGRLLVTSDTAHVPDDVPFLAGVVPGARRRSASRSPRTHRAVAAGLEQHGYALRTIALKLTAVASFYRYCEQEELLARTPMTCVRRPRVERLSPRGALSRGQVHDLLAAAERLGPHPYGLCSCWR
jgi:hypothetical protein